MSLRGWIYDRTVTRVTAAWYAAVLARLPVGARLLDVGIGTGGALLGNAATLRDKQLEVVGIDIDAAYLSRCREAVDAAGLADRIVLREQSVHDFTEPGFDAVYFSGSFMLVPRPADALRHVAGLLSENGAVYFTQTFEDRTSAVVERVKPLLGKLTTIEFGRVTYEDEFMQTLAAGGLTLVEQVVLAKGRRRSAVLVIATAS